MADRRRFVAAPGVAKPAMPSPIGAGLVTHKALKTRKSFTLVGETQKCSVKVKPTPADAAMIIGFDAEWVTEPAKILVDDDDDGDGDRPAPVQSPHNLILSYQYAGRCKGREWSGIIYTRAGARIRYPGKPETEITRLPERIRLAELLAAGIEAGIKHRHLTRWPVKVVAAAHWTRADLSAMADFEAIKSQFDGVQKTYASLSAPYIARVNVAGHVREFDVSLIDTQLLVPGSSKSLAALGDLYQFPKLNPGSKEIVRNDGIVERIPYIERMDLLLADDPHLYERYAIRDAEISAHHVHGVWTFANDQLALGLTSPPVTLGSLAVRNLVEGWKSRSIDVDAVLGGRVENVQRYDPHRRRYVWVRERTHPKKYLRTAYHAAECFHGGRNECFCYGPTIDTAAEGTPPFREYDLTSAYAVAMASIRTPNWNGLYACSDPEKFVAGVIGAADISFRFSAGTRFPSVPVVAPDEYGLIYPMEGRACVTAAEVEVARRQGAQIKILDGIIVPWYEVGGRPFMMLIEELQRRREQYSKGTLQNELFKQLGNSIYGKLGQGIKGTSVYDTRTGGRNTIGPCEITNPFLAGYVSGLIRALISELLASIPADRAVVSVTTDAFITNAGLGEISMHGPVATLLAEIKNELTGDPTLLETKFEARQLLPWRTRGVATLKIGGGSKPKLARGGMREPRGMSLEQANEWFAQRMLLRQPGDKWSSLDPLPFPTAHRNNADHVFQEHSRKVNFEYDLKRRPINPMPRYVAVPGDGDLIVQHLAFETTPWRTIEEFVEQRKRFDQWRLRN